MKQFKRLILQSIKTLSRHLYIDKYQIWLIQKSVTRVQKLQQHPCDHAWRSHPKEIALRALMGSHLLIKLFSDPIQVIRKSHSPQQATSPAERREKVQSWALEILSRIGLSLNMPQQSTNKTYHQRWKSNLVESWTRKASKIWCHQRLK